MYSCRFEFVSQFLDCILFSLTTSWFQCYPSQMRLCPKPMDTENPGLQDDVDNLHPPLPLESAGFSVLSSTSFLSLPFFLLYSHLPFWSQGTLPWYFASIFCLKYTRFAVTWRATVFAFEPGPWPEAAFLSSAGVLCLGGSALGHCT